MSSAWRHCSRCKTAIVFEATYWTCNVSTCNRKRSQLVFCGMDCWDAHLPIARHREAWAEEQQAPTQAEAGTEAATAARVEPQAERPSSPSAPVPRTGSGTGTRRRVEVPRPRGPQPPKDVLVVASKLKVYIKEASGMNTSASVMDRLSDKIRDLCDEAIKQARAAERQTVMDRDFR
ncbi:MAG: hypothetical protein V3V08_10490 [Nannocystaceae bacterium]